MLYVLYGWHLSHYDLIGGRVCPYVKPTVMCYVLTRYVDRLLCFMLQQCEKF